MGVETSKGMNWRFGSYELEGRTTELRRNGVAIKLQEQPSRLLLVLLEHAGQVVTRDEIRQQLWPAETFVDFDHALNTAVMKLREALGDSSERSVFIQTIPRKGYRFVAPVSVMPSNGADRNGGMTTSGLLPDQVAEGRESNINSGNVTAPDNLEPWVNPIPKEERSPSVRSRWSVGTTRGQIAPEVRLLVLCGFLFLSVFGGVLIYNALKSPLSRPRSLTRVTFEDGLQSDPTFSPDGRYIAYSSDQGGSTNIWVQQLSAGDPIQVTKGPGPNWQPEWSPDGKYIAYRSDSQEGGIYIVPALGGVQQQQMISPFGYTPRWSPDSSQVLFQTGAFVWVEESRFYVVGLDGASPHEVLREFLDQHDLRGSISAAWHPDGRRVTIWAHDPSQSGPGLSFWTVPLGGGDAVHSAIATKIRNELDELTVQSGSEWVLDRKFSWAPSGEALYLEGTFRGVRSLWRLDIDARSLGATGFERLTAGGSLDNGPAISPDGKKLAFTAARGEISAWLYPLDGNHARIIGAGKPITSPGIESWLTTMSKDGTKLAFSGIRAGEPRLWVKSPLDGRESPLFVDSYIRAGWQWSPDGARLAYSRRLRGQKEFQLVTWSAESRREEPVMALSNLYLGASDWSPDGKSLLLMKRTGRSADQKRPGMPEWLGLAIWQVPLEAAPHAELKEQKILSDPNYALFQAHFSPDGQWIAFEGVRQKGPDSIDDKLSSTLFVTRSTGGPWVPITDGRFWADKPRWSPDGRTIYFLLNEGSFFNVWAIKFDPEAGRPVGDAFRVTALNSPSLMIPRHMGSVEIDVSERFLVLTLGQISGGIWVLDHANQ